MAIYNPNTDYEALIQAAAKKGNMTEAAALEQMRNQKIVGEGLNYDQTYRYQNFLQGAQPAQGYQSPYSSQISAALSGLQNSQWGGWDKDTDPSYQAYRKEYLREADRSMEDTLGAYATNTGGVASSAAITAASQAADYYKSQLSDKIPELYQNAYNRYLGDLQARQQNLSMMMQAEDQAASQYYNQINAAMNKWAQLGYADADVAGVLGVGIGTPTSDQSYTNWSTAFQEQQYNDALAAEQAKLAAKAAGGGGGSGGMSSNRKAEIAQMASKYYDTHQQSDDAGNTSYGGLSLNGGLLDKYLARQNLNGDEATFFKQMLASWGVQ